MVAGAVNVAFNLVFVTVLHLDVAGVALATIISQYLSATLVIIRLSRLEDECKLDLRHMRISRRLFVKIIKVGIPAGIQGCLFSFSNVIIQSSVNSFDKIGVAGNGAAGTIDGLIYIALNSFYHAALTFSGQNLGARQIKRVKKTCYYCLALVLAIGIPLCIVTYMFGQPLLGIFLSDDNAANKQAILEFGMERMLYTTLTYFLCGLMEVMSGMLRGLGASTTSMIVSLIGACAMRVVWVYTIFESIRTPGSLYVSYPISWLATTIVLYICYTVILKRIEDRLKNPTPPMHHKGA
jgi:Na+-driven multidrug efflux pump